MEFTHPEYLVSPAWLADHLDDPTVTVLDVTAKLTSRLDNEPGRQCFAEAHIAGSILFDVASAKGALSDPEAALPWTWPSPERFTATMADHGVGADTRVVLVARTPRPGIDSGTMWCTRAWWTMHHFGVDCAILLGGIEGWDADGFPMTGDEAPTPTPPTRPLEPATGWERGRADRDDVLTAIGDGNGGTCLVDALSAASFAGQEATYGRPGHIAGAVNVPFRGLIEGETCRFVDAATMHRTLTEAGVLDAPRVITYCGGAIAATVDAFCLALLGHDRVAVYDASLMEWAADPSLPMIGPEGP
jgi:thiosulfate/3-mercaptopyruvate sulfurtransferase